MAATGTRKDPLRGFRFLVEIDGITRGGFREVSSADISNDVVEYREGKDPNTPRKMPGLRKQSNITLKWGQSDDDEIWKWRNEVAKGKVEGFRKSAAIIQIDDEGNRKVTWEFKEAWPAKLVAPSLNATTNEVSIASLELVVESLEMKLE